MPFIVIVVYVVAVVLVYTFRIIPEDYVEAANDTVIAFATGFGAWQVFRITRLFTPGETSYRCWMFFAFGLLMDSIGHFTYSIAQLVLGTFLTFPHAADWFIIVAQFAYAISFIMFLRQMRSLDITPKGIIPWIANGLFLVLLGLNIYFIILPTMQLEEETVLMRALFLVYPLYDTILAYTGLHLALMFYAMGRSPLTKPWTVLVIAFLIMMVTDSAFAYVDLNDHYHPYLLINPGWGLAYLLISYAAYLQRGLVTRIMKTPDNYAFLVQDSDEEEIDYFGTD